MSYRHGHARSKTVGPSPTYRTWAGMKARCDNPNEPNYSYYGGRGLGYDPDWSDFNAFLRDMGERPEGYTLERIDNSKGYSRYNCTWATPMEQAHNRRIPSNNTSGVKGVIWHKRWQRWEASGMRGGQRFFLYAGHSFEEACAARHLWESHP